MMLLAQQSLFLDSDRCVAQTIHRAWTGTCVALADLLADVCRVPTGLPELLQTRGPNGTTSESANPTSQTAVNADATCRILVVEDECIIALDLMSTLRQIGYGVTSHAISGEEAIEQAAKFQPNLALMDIRLKGNIDGIEAAQQIHARWGIPVIFLTAFTDDDTMCRAQKVGMAGFLRKPFSAQQLQAAILSALQNQDGK